MSNNKLKINLKDCTTTKEKLVKVTQHLLASYGYEATSVRLIADYADVSLSAISFHFGSKEKLVHSAVQKAADDLRISFGTYTEEIRSFANGTDQDRNQAWQYLDRFLEEHINHIFNPKYSSLYIGLVSQENGFPKSCQGILSKAVVEQSEKVLVQLIALVMPEPNMFQAAIAARCIIAAIMSYMEKPILNKELEKAVGVNLEDSHEVAVFMHHYFMSSLHSFVESAA